jgi:hypothetical protein
MDIPPATVLKPQSKSLCGHQVMSVLYSPVLPLVSLLEMVAK